MSKEVRRRRAGGSISLGAMYKVVPRRASAGRKKKNGTGTKI